MKISFLGCIVVMLICSCDRAPTDNTNPQGAELTRMENAVRAHIAARQWDQARAEMAKWPAATSERVEALRREITAAHVEDVAEAIERRKQPRIGMGSLAAMNTEWGRPNRVDRVETKAGLTETWHFNNGSHVIVANGQVVLVAETR